MSAKLLFAYAMCVIENMAMTRFWRPGWQVFIAIDVVICAIIALSVIPNPRRITPECTSLPRNGHEKPGN